jgi:hypothetical protein
MAPGGVLEIIWHFAGYWHLSEDFAAARPVYDEALYKSQNSDYRLALDGASISPLDTPDIVGQPVRNIFQSLSASSSSSPNEFKLHHNEYSRIDSQVYPLDRAAENENRDGLSGGDDATINIRYGHVVHHIRHYVEHDANPRAEHGTHHREPTYAMSYDDPPAGVIGKLTQANSLSDSDWSSDGGHTYDALHSIDSSETISHLVHMGEDLVPDAAVPLGELGDAGTTALRMHDGAIANGTIDPGAVEPGRYVNGERQAADSQDSEVTAVVDPPHPPIQEEGSTDPGQVAETGNNKAENAALILDFNEAPATMIVQGNYFSTNAIIQANILQNQDHVLDAGTDSAPVTEGGNSTDNIATFNAKEVLEAGGYHSLRGDLKVNVDYIDGDLFDIKALTQRSFVQDGDVSVQTQMQSYSEIHSGSNEQYNVAKFVDWGKGYDVIVVLGDYHSANIISQLNVVLDSDLIGVNFHASEDGTSTVLTDQNNLQNEAAIHTFGSTTFDALNGDIESLIQSLGSREALDREAWSSFQGAASGTFNVLFVTGSYYDLNIINQVNIISDSDVAVQWAGEESSLQWLSTGGNTAGNFAQIVDGGASSSQILGGNAYEDSILLQANLVSDTTQTVATDPTALVTELVAFVDHAQGNVEADASAWTKDVFGNQHDTFGHVLT